VVGAAAEEILEASEMGGEIDFNERWARSAA